MTAKSLKTALCVSASVVVLMIASSSAFAADIGYLENKLDKAMQQIDIQSKQIKQMSLELKRLKAEQSSSEGNTNKPKIEKRLTEVEEMVFKLDDKIGSRAVVNAFDTMKLDIGGVVHTTYTHLNSDSGSASAFDTQNFELLSKAEIDED